MRAANPWTILLLVFKMRVIEDVKRIAVLAVFLAAGWVVCSPALAGRDAFAASLSYDSPEALARDHARAFRVVAAPAARKKAAFFLREYFACVEFRDGAGSACGAVDPWIGDFMSASCKSRYRKLVRGGGRKTRCESAGRKAVGAYAAALRSERKVFAKVWSEILEMRQRNAKAYKKADAQLDRALAAPAEERRVENERRLAEDRNQDEERRKAEEFSRERERQLSDERRFAEERRIEEEFVVEAERKRKMEEARAYQAARESDTEKRSKKGLPMRKKTQ